jgi:PAS domain S-box-containing protein
MIASSVLVMDELRWAAEVEVVGDVRALVLEGVIATLPMPVVVYRRDGRWVAANDRYVDLFGRVPTGNILLDAVGRPVGVDDGFRRALGGEPAEVPGFWCDPVLRSADEPRAGRRRFLGATLVPVRGASGAVEHVALVLRDDTDDELGREEDERAREQLRAELAHEAAVAGELRSSVTAQATAQRLTRVGSFEIHLADDGVEASVRWSDEVYRIFGYRPGEVELTEAVFFDAVHPDDRARVKAAMGRTVETGQRFELDHRIVLPDGRERIVCAQAILEHGVSGRPNRVVGTVQDVTDQRLAESVLRESEERLQMALATGRMMAWEVDLTTRRLYVSRNAGEVLGLRPGQRLETMADADALVVPADRRAVADYLSGPAGDPDLELRVTRPIDGRTITILSRRQAATGAPAGRLRGLAIDITEQKRLDDALRASELRYRTLVELAPEAIVVFDVDSGHFVDVNANALRLFEATRDELRHLGPVQVSPPLQPDGRPTAEAARGYLVQALAGDTPVFEWLHRSLRGREIWCEVRLCRMPGDARRLVRGSIYDITERKRLEELRARSAELEVQNRRIREASRLKSEFLANMSHELRTPLNAIIGFAELLHDGHVPPDAPQFREFLGDILTSGRHLLQLINDVLDLSKIEAGKTEFRAESIDAARLIGEVVAILRTAAARKRIAVAIEVEPGLDDLRRDPARLKQVLYNYLSNAIKFTGDGGRVAVTARGDGPDRLRLEVVDTGPGIATVDLGKLFVEFQQLDAAHRQVGTGLGLAVTRRLVEAQGGAVGVLSTLGQGSTFYAVLPRRFGGEVVRRTRTLSSVPIGVSRVLVVDDDAADQRVLADGLAAAGYDVVLAASAGEALARARSEHFDAATVDLLLPDVSGLELIRDLRASAAGRELPIIVVTVVGDASAVAGFAVTAVMAKPVDAAQVAAALTAAGVPPLAIRRGDAARGAR